MKAAIDAGNYDGNVEKTEEKLKEIRELIPFKLSEAEPKSN